MNDQAIGIWGRTIVAEFERLARAWPDEWRDGARAGHFQKYEGEREPSGYPMGFHRWKLDRRLAWLAGFNYGFHKCLRELRP